MGALHTLMKEPRTHVRRCSSTSARSVMQPAKRACDACHRRKIKCQGTQTCSQCLSARLQCTYNAIPQKKGPKPFRLKQTRENSCSPTKQHPGLMDAIWRRLNGVDVPFQGSFFSPDMAILDGETIGQCIAFFYHTLYSRMPVLDQQTMERQVDSMDRCPDAYCLVMSLCALSMLQLGVRQPEHYEKHGSPPPTVSAKTLIAEVLRVQDGLSGDGPVSVCNIATRYLLFAYYHVHSNYNKAWYHLREGATMICLGNMDDESYYLGIDPAEATHRRHLFWLFYTVERAYALQHQLPVTLQPTIDRPRSCSSPDDHTASSLSSFILLLDIYRPFEEPFIDIWQKTCGRVPQQQLVTLWQQLIADTETTSSHDGNFTDANANANKAWLTDTFWQLSNYRVDSYVHDGGSDSSSDDEAADMAAGVSREKLATLTAQFPYSSAELVESCFVENLLITAYWVMELLLLHSPPGAEFVTGNKLHLDHMFRIVAMIREDHRFLPLLLDKVNKVIPYLINPIL